MTDADCYQTLAKYNFYFGSMTWAQTPSPNSGQAAPTRAFTYDSAARVQQITNGVNNGYKRFVYWWDGLQTLSWESVQNGGDDHYTNTGTDGAGPLRGVDAECPNSAGGSWPQYHDCDT